jgi:hypothetical protein
MFRIRYPVKRHWPAERVQRDRLNLPCSPADNGGKIRQIRHSRTSAAGARSLRAPVTGRNPFMWTLTVALLAGVLARADRAAGQPRPIAGKHPPRSPSGRSAPGSPTSSAAPPHVVRPVEGRARWAENRWRLEADGRTLRTSAGTRPTPAKRLACEVAQSQSAR